MELSSQYIIALLWCCCCCSLSRGYPAFMSILYKDKAQAEFVSSLSHYYITRPRFSLSRHVHLQKLSWNTIKTLQPELFYAKLRFNYQTFKLELRQNRHLISKGFTLEDDVRNVDDLSRYARPSNEYYKKLACYYSGHISRKPNSRVALSICDGLKGFISFEEGTFFIEPMREIGPNLLHLVYEATAELNSTHNPKKGQNLTCSTGNLHRGDDIFTAPIDTFTGNSPAKTFNNHNKNSKYSSRDESAVNLEVFIVVDKYMVKFHGNESVQDYVLTMMNMVSDMFNEPSLGVRINIIVSKVLILHSDLPDLNISHNGDKTLFSFCEWQFMREISNIKANLFPRSYDVALLLTRKDVCAHSNRPCGTIGLAYISGTCTPNRKCGVVEDIGLNTAYTIAHELGHNSYKSYCLRETYAGNRLSDFHRSGVLPGQLYDADTQCKQQYGGVAKHCPYFKLSGKKTEICKQLWCEIEEEDECVSKLDPPAKGTKCDNGKWCMYGHCVNNTDIPDAVHGGWGPWFNWTKCSRSCGVGVSFMERFCNKPYPLNGGQYCAGEARRYTTCNTQPCPEKSIDVRTLQCEEFNNGTVTYIPIHSESQPCALHCRPRTNTAHYSVKLKNKVTDGTPCRADSTNICVDGKCENLGCDLKLNSKLEKDICGVCGGKGESCNLIEGEFTQPLGKGYVHAVDIPLGAKNVLVKEVKPCASFLALKSGHGSYHINGNWTIELPGRYNVNGTVIYYRRRGTQEFFFTDGPTLEEMHFMVLYQDFNFGVKYRYVLPINETAVTNMEETKGSFGWVEGSWKHCSVVCGGGIMRQEKPQCLHMYDGQINLVNDSLCSGAKMPPTSVKACNEHECPKVWFVTPWNTCSKTCGLGRQKRSVSCKEQQMDGTWKNRLQSDCDVSERPVAIQTCVRKSCYLSWKTDAWSKCRAKCGHTGLKYRKVTCPMVGSCLQSVKPKATMPCKGPDCVYSWIPEPWIQCSTSCGVGIQTRKVFCREEDSFVKANGMCQSKLKPKTRRKCYMKFCSHVKVIENAPIVKREALKPKMTSHEKRRTKRILLPKAPIKNSENKNCVKDELGAVTCNMKIIISRYANKPFCKIPHERIRCCISCRQHLKYLPITPRKQIR